MADYRDPKVTTPNKRGGGMGKWIAIAVVVILLLLLLGWWGGWWGGNELDGEAVVVPEGTVVAPEGTVAD